MYKCISVRVYNVLEHDEPISSFMVIVASRNLGVWGELRSTCAC